MSKKKNNKKKKTVYVDDGRTVADMSGLYGRKGHIAPKSTAKERGRTYWNAVKLMFKPMLVTMGIITVAFLIMWILLTISIGSST